MVEIQLWVLPSQAQGLDGNTPTEQETGSLNIVNRPWLVWLSSLGDIPQSGRPLVRFPVRVHAWVWFPAGVHRKDNRSMLLILMFSLFLPPFPSLKINKMLF